MSAPRVPETGFRPPKVYAAPPAAGRADRTIAAWVMVRLTGVLLSVLVLGHFSLTHLFTDVGATGVTFISRRWSTTLWPVWDWLLLVTAIVHGASGVWVAIDDYTPSRTRRRARRAVLVAVSAIVVALGSIAIVVVTVG